MLSRSLIITSSPLPLLSKNKQPTTTRTLKVLAALYADPTSGYPPKYARDSIPVIKSYPDGQTVPSPKSESTYKPGELLGCSKRQTNKTTL
jgi:hypothetical protein